VSSETAQERRSARERILDAAARRIVRGGAAALALADVAADAGVSKALIHYHFHDKDRLLEQLVEQLARNVVDRERAALEPYAKQHSPLAVDALWQWLEGELVRGSVRVLTELRSFPRDSVRNAAERAAALRRRQASETVERLFAILELQSRVHTSLLAAVMVAFVDGLALDFAARREQGDEESSSPRVAFDVFWLAMLSLAE
jgi:AcrR family transcriptional regulator